MMTSILSHPARGWQVLLLGGPSGVGKSSISYRLAQHFGVGLTEVDDFQVVLEKMTTPEQQPAIHYWNTHPEAAELPAEKILELHLNVCRALAPALEAVIANHLESAMPVVLEGDFILPALATQTSFGDQLNNGQVRALFLAEPDINQLLHNFAQREPDHGPQEKRAQVSWHFGHWLQQEAERYGIPVLPARPWKTVLERALQLLATSAS
jgi:2-phosphoglycerate kinase